MKAGCAGVERDSGAAVEDRSAELLLEGSHLGAAGEEAAAQDPVDGGPLLVSDDRSGGGDDAHATSLPARSVRTSSLPR